MRNSQANPAEIQLIGLKHLNLSKASKEIADALWAKDTGEEDTVDLDKNIADLAEVNFVHLHNHSQFSVLQSTMSVKDLVQLAAKEEMPAVGLTDHGNMMGAFHFVKAVKAHNKSVKEKNAEATEKNEPATAKEIKPIVG